MPGTITTPRVGNGWTPQQPRHRRGRKRAPGSPGFIERHLSVRWAVIILVAMVLLAGLLLWLLPNPAPAPTTPPQALPAVTLSTAPVQGSPTAAAPASTQPAAVAAGADCPATAPVSDARLDLIPEDIEWSLVGTMATPAAVSTGPVFASDNVWRCYARSPQGAAFAATSFISGIVAATPEARVDLIEQRVSRSVGYDALLTQAKIEAGGVKPTSDLPGDEDTGSGRQFAAVRWIDYTPDRTTLQVAYRITVGPTAGEYNAATYTMAWEGGDTGDWRLVYPGNGLALFQPLSSLAGFVPMAGA